MTVNESEDPGFIAFRSPGGERLRELVNLALNNLARVNLSLSLVVLRDSLRLWGEFISDGSLLQVSANSKHVQQPESHDNLVARAGAAVDRAEPLIQAAGEIDLADEGAQTRLALDLLTAFERAVSEAFHHRHEHDATVVDERSGELVEAFAWRHGWDRRRHMLQETANCIPYLAEVRELAAASVEQTVTARNDMQATIAELHRLSEELAEARADRAQLELATHFSRLAGGERLASNVFRTLTALLLTAAAIAGWRLAGADGWEGALAHAFVVAAIGAAAAYTARLGTSHRATADWAKSIHVQLNTFKDFLAEVHDDDVKNRVYEEFGRRVLGAPPSHNGEDPAPLPATQLLELASIIASASRK